MIGCVPALVGALAVLALRLYPIDEGVLALMQEDLTGSKEAIA
jgi:hypothetical protein